MSGEFYCSLLITVILAGRGAVIAGSPMTLQSSHSTLRSQCNQCTRVSGDQCSHCLLPYYIATGLCIVLLVFFALFLPESLSNPLPEQATSDLAADLEQRLNHQPDTGIRAPPSDDSEFFQSALTSHRVLCWNSPNVSNSCRMCLKISVAESSVDVSSKGSTGGIIGWIGRLLAGTPLVLWQLMNSGSAQMFLIVAFMLNMGAFFGFKDSALQVLVVHSCLVV